jgi:tRNA A37 N6-isopentenylltransferase MiaA
MDELDTILLTYLDTFQHVSRQYARRQWQWFKKQKYFYWIPKEIPEDLSTSFNTKSLLDAVLHFIHTPRSSFESDPFLSQLNEHARQEGSDNFKKLYDYKPKLTVYNDKQLRLDFIEKYMSWVDKQVALQQEE